MWRKRKKSKNDDKPNYTRDRKEIINSLEKNGFTITKIIDYGSNFGIIRAEKSDSRMQISTYEKFVNDHTELYLAFVIHTEQVNKTNFKLVQREETSADAVPKAFDDRLDIISFESRNIIDQLLLNTSKGVKEGLNSIKPHLEYFTLSGTQMVIELGVKYNLTTALDALKFLSNFLNVIKTQYSKLLVFSGEKKYMCVYCRKEIPLEGKTCPHCGKKAPICVICKVDPEPGEAIIQYECCNAYAHLEHALKWKEVSDICPSCKTREPKFNRVV